MKKIDFQYTLHSYLETCKRNLEILYYSISNIDIYIGDRTALTIKTQSSSPYIIKILPSLHRSSTIIYDRNIFSANIHVHWRIKYSASIVHILVASLNIAFKQSSDKFCKDAQSEFGTPCKHMLEEEFSRIIHVLKSL